MLNTLPYLAALENEGTFWDLRNEGMTVKVVFTNKGHGPALTKTATLTLGGHDFAGAFDNPTVAPDVWVAARFLDMDQNVIAPDSEPVLKCIYEDAFGGISTLIVKLRLSDINRQPGKPAQVEITGYELTNETLDLISEELRRERDLRGQVGA